MARSLTQHIELSLSTANFSPDLRSDPNAERAVAAILESEVRETLSRPGVRLVLSQAERNADETVRSFVTESLYAAGSLQDASFEHQLDAVVAFSFDSRFGAMTGRGHAAARLAGVRGPLPSALRNPLADAEYGAGKAHEYGHAAGYVLVEPSEFSPDLRLPFARDGVAITTEGWCRKVPSSNHCGFAVLYRMHEEAAATVLSASWHAAAGSVEELVTIPFMIGFTFKRDFDHSLRKALEILHPDCRIEPLQPGQGVDGETHGTVVPFSWLRWRHAHGVSRSVYGTVLPAFDALALEVYPSLPEGIAPSFMRARLREVQAYGGHTALLSLFERAFGREGAEFLARLEPPSSFSAVAIDTVLLGLYADAGRLERRQDCTAARQLLHQARRQLEAERERMARSGE